MSNLLKDTFAFHSPRVSQLVTLHVDLKPVSVLCKLGDFGCGEGGWTPVMKIDGNKVYLTIIPRARVGYLTIILRNRAEYRLILSRRGRRPSRLKLDDIPRD